MVFFLSCRGISLSSDLCGKQNITNRLIWLIFSLLKYVQIFRIFTSSFILFRVAIWLALELGFMLSLSYVYIEFQSSWALKSKPFRPLSRLFTILQRRNTKCVGKSYKTFNAFSVLFVLLYIILFLLGRYLFCFEYFFLQILEFQCLTPSAVRTINIKGPSCPGLICITYTVRFASNRSVEDAELVFRMLFKESANAY